LPVNLDAPAQSLAVRGGKRNAGIYRSLII
jgi:hypothetical protein